MGKMTGLCIFFQPVITLELTAFKYIPMTGMTG